MSFFRWAMRYGAAILFVLALVQLVFGVIAVLQLYFTMGAGASYEGNAVSERPATMLMLVQALIGTFATPALTFFGALVINRLDLWLGDRKQAEPFE